MFNVSALLLMLPSVNFGIIAAEIFPWPILIWIFYTRNLTKPILLMMVMLTGWALYSTLIYYERTNPNTDIIRSLVSYMNPLFAYLFIINLDKNKLLKFTYMIHVYFGFLIMLGFVQLIGSDALDSVLKILVPRSSGMMLSESNRGVTLLATEPSRAGVELSLLYIMIRLTKFNNLRFHYFDIVVLIIQLALIKSANAAVFYLLSISLIWVNRKCYTPLIILFAASITGVFSIFQGRFIDLIIDVINMGYNDQLFMFIINESGNRLAALFSFVVFGLNNLFGSGVGMWPIASIDAYSQSGFDSDSLRFFDVVGQGAIVGTRGPGIISNLMLEIGLIGTVTYMFLLLRAYLRLKIPNSLNYTLMTIFLIKIALFGSPGNPFPFVMLAYIGAYHRMKTT